LFGSAFGSGEFGFGSGEFGFGSGEFGFGSGEFSGESGEKGNYYSAREDVCDRKRLRGVNSELVDKIEMVMNGDLKATTLLRDLYKIPGPCIKAIRDKKVLENNGGIIPNVEYMILIIIIHLPFSIIITHQ
ncbi:hypothetical protein CAPTEDRAFT_204259, partial [Capitella teleta]